MVFPILHQPLRLNHHASGFVFERLVFAPMNATEVPKSPLGFQLAIIPNQEK